MDMTLPRLDFVPFAFPGVPNVRCAFQLRAPAEFRDHPDADTIALAPDSAPNDPAKARIVLNRRAIAPTLGISAWAEMHQVHGDAMSFEPEATRPEQGSPMQVDGLATTRADFGLLVKTADCQPIFLADSAGRHVAALHVGWRGNRINFPGSAVAAFCKQYNLKAEELYAVRGPSLGRGAAEFIEPEREWSPEFMRWYDAPSKTMDLWGMTRDQLLQAGLLPQRIYGIDMCTLSLNDRLFSFRAGDAGRQASLIWLLA